MSKRCCVAYTCSRWGACASGQFWVLPEVSELFSSLQDIIYFISFREILCLKKLTCKKECFTSELLHSFILYLVEYKLKDLKLRSVRNRDLEHSRKEGEVSV